MYQYNAINNGFIEKTKKFIPNLDNIDIRIIFIFEVLVKGGIKMLSKLEPFRELTTLQDRLNKVFEGLLPTSTVSKEGGEWVPAVDVYEDKESVIIEVEAPGMKEEDLKVNLENNTLVISGERKFEKEEKDKNYYRMERSYGSFVRSFLLPDNVDATAIKAKYKDGVLKLTLPKKAESKPKSIPIEKEEK